MGLFCLRMKMKNRRRSKRFLQQNLRREKGICGDRRPGGRFCGNTRSARLWMRERWRARLERFIFRAETAGVAAAAMIGYEFMGK